MKYILFILLMNGQLTTIEMNNEASCNLAAARAERHTIVAAIDFDTPRVAAAWCSAKGGE